MHRLAAALLVAATLPCEAATVRGALVPWSTSVTDLDPNDGVAAAVSPMPGSPPGWFEQAATPDSDMSGRVTFGGGVGVSGFGEMGFRSVFVHSSVTDWLSVTPHTSVTITGYLSTYVAAGQMYLQHDEGHGSVGYEMVSDGGTIDRSHATASWDLVATEPNGPSSASTDWTDPNDAPRLWITFTNDTDSTLHMRYGYVGRAWTESQWVGAAPVPEPATWLLLCAGSLALYATSLRRRQQQQR